MCQVCDPRLLRENRRAKFFQTGQDLMSPHLPKIIGLIHTKVTIASFT